MSDVPESTPETTRPATDQSVSSLMSTVVIKRNGALLGCSKCGCKLFAKDDKEPDALMQCVNCESYEWVGDLT
jgi:hypothetical protein